MIYSAELTLALEHVHAQDVIFRDLKPENVMVGVDGHVKLTDFGLSKKARGPPPPTTTATTAVATTHHRHHHYHQRRHHHHHHYHHRPAPDLHQTSTRPNPNPDRRRPLYTYQVDPSAGPMTRGSMVGTPEYMAPELLAGRPYGRGVDWWTLGCLIYEMITGRGPFNHPDMSEVRHATPRHATPRHTMPHVAQTPD